MIENELLDTQMIAAAHHEAGHIVVAAASELKLLEKGIIVDAAAQGLACYCKDAGESDALRKRVLAATFAGFYAEDLCRRLNGFCLRPENWLALRDGWEANSLLMTISEDNLVEGNVTLTGEEAKRQSRMLVAGNWHAIEEVAKAVLAKEWEPMPQFRSEDQWSSETAAKQLRGEEIVTILAQFDIQAARVSKC